MNIWKFLTSPFHYVFVIRPERRRVVREIMNTLAKTSCVAGTLREVTRTIVDQATSIDDSFASTPMSLDVDRTRYIAQGDITLPASALNLPLLWRYDSRDHTWSLEVRRVDNHQTYRFVAHPLENNQLQVRVYAATDLVKPKGVKVGQHTALPLEVFDYAR